VRQLEGARFFGFDAAKNTAIDQDARQRFRAIAEVVDPRLGDADADGTWRPPGDVAVPRFTAAHLAPVPVELDDITARLTGAKCGSPFPTFAGCDFQKFPWHAMVFLRALAILAAQNPALLEAERQRVRAVYEAGQARYQEQKEREVRPSSVEADDLDRGMADFVIRSAISTANRCVQPRSERERIVEEITRALLGEVQS
jgi:hypothetical protein